MPVLLRLGGRSSTIVLYVLSEPGWMNTLTS